MPCNLRQIVNISVPVSSNNVCLKDSDGTLIDMEYSYSVDSITWSDWSDCESITRYTSSLGSEYFLKLRVYGNPVSVLVDNKPVDFKVSLAPSFDFSQEAITASYDPYSNLDCAMNLYQSLTEQVSNMIGIPCWYFKVSPDAVSKDVTFKEYCHLAVTAVKYIKIIIEDGQMPSSKPDFEDFGISFNTDWETELSKATFATAFGNTAQPQEGDLVYIPMMNRMWQVTSAYEEKKDGFMWNATTFKIYLRKYESQDSISTGDFEASIDSVIKNTYEDLFGETVQATNTDTLTAPVQALPTGNNMTAVWKQDAYRKEISLDTLKIKEDPTYHRGMLVADNWYAGNIQIIYQKKYCGSDGTVSFFIQNNGGSGEIIRWGNQVITKSDSRIRFGNIELNISSGTWMIWARWNFSLKRIEAGAAPLSFPENIPLTRLRPGIYYFDFTNAVKSDILYTREYVISDKTDIVFYGNNLDLFSGIKFYDNYEELEYLLPQYPNSSHLLINDTVRQIVGINGFTTNNIRYQ